MPDVVSSAAPAGGGPGVARRGALGRSARAGGPPGVGRRGGRERDEGAPIGMANLRVVAPESRDGSRRGGRSPGGPPAALDRAPTAPDRGRFFRTTFTTPPPRAASAPAPRPPSPAPRPAP